MTRLNLFFLIAVAFAVEPAAGAGEAAHIRINQLGYATGHPARVYLMSERPVEGARFTVVDSRRGTTQSVRVGESTGKWGAFTVYALDFTPSAPGTYWISVAGRVFATSPEFHVGSGDELYSAALANALSFYREQRDGPEFIASVFRRAPGHLNDAFAKVYQTPTFSHEGSRIDGDLVPTGATIDASGGWADAGDYLKFVHTTSYAVALMLVGVRDFPEQMGSSSEKANFTDEAKFGLEWLLRMWDDKSKTLYYQVGIGSINPAFQNDHGRLWRLPQVDDTSHPSDPSYRYIRNRPVFIAGPAGSKISPNLAGRLAADFALCYRIYHLNSPSFAKQCLEAAEHLFDLADTRRSQQLLTAAPYDFYEETQWRDDLEFAGVELYFGLKSGGIPEGLPHTDPDFYLRSAADWAAAYIHADHSSGILSLGDVSALAHYDLFRALASESDAKDYAVTPADLLGNLKKTLDAAVAQSASDPFGYGVPWGIGDTPTQGASLVVLASAYDHLANTSRYAPYVDRWLGNILGANAWGVSLIVGDGSSFPRCIHHQVANLIGSHDGRPPILAGAVVEGPIRHPKLDPVPSAIRCPHSGGDPFAPFNRRGAIYHDDVRFYSTNEPALDLTAPSFLAFSWRIRDLSEPAALHADPGQGFPAGGHGADAAMRSQSSIRKQPQ